MSKTQDHPTELDPVQREAVAWVQQLLSGDATADDAAALQRWRTQSAAHAAAFAAASRAWRNAGPAGENLRRQGGAMAIDLADLRLRHTRMNRRAMLGGGFAAVAASAAYAFINPPLGLWPSLSELNADYRTGTGEQKNVTFADNVSIRMNTQTSIALQAVESEEDRIRLVAGEASFTTPPRARRSLAVLAASGTSITSRARFDVRHLSGGAGGAACVTCFDGTVRIEHRNETVTLMPGQQISYDAGGLGGLNSIDLESASDWQRGIVVFRATSLADVVEEINRYRPGKIILTNAVLGRRQVTGRFRIDQMNEILSRLELAFGARIKTLPGGVVLMS